MENNEKDRDIIERKRKEIIDIARKTNLADYLLSKGVPLGKKREKIQGCGT